MGIVILRPDINQSDIGFTIIADKHSLNKKAIRFGLSAIKNVGEAAIGAILKARAKKDFSSLTDFCRRVDAQKVNKKVLESLVQVGGFDRFGKRSGLMMALEAVRQKASDHQKQASSPQVSLFAGTKTDEQAPVDLIPETAEFSKADRLSFEKNLLGFYLTEHPLADALKRIRELVSHPIGELNETENLNQTVTVGGALRSVKKILTKNGNKEMAFGILEDATGSIELVVFPKTYAATRSIWIADQPVLVTGRVDFKDRLSLIVDTALRPTDDQLIKKVSSSASTYILSLDSHTKREDLVEINQLLKSNPGENQVIIELTNGGTKTKTIKLPFAVDVAKLKGKLTFEKLED